MDECVFDRTTEMLIYPLMLEAHPLLDVRNLRNLGTVQMHACMH